MECYNNCDQGDRNNIYLLGLTKDGSLSGDIVTRRRGWRWLDGTRYSYSNWDDSGFIPEPTDQYRHVVMVTNGAWRVVPNTDIYVRNIAEIQVFN